LWNSAARDVPEGKRDCEDLRNEEVYVEQVDNTSHAEIYLAQRTFEIVLGRIKAWLEP